MSVVSVWAWRVAWWGSNQVFPIFFADPWREEEIWGQLVDLAGIIFTDDFESGSTAAWDLP